MTHLRGSERLIVIGDGSDACEIAVNSAEFKRHCRILTARTRSLSVSKEAGSPFEANPRHRRRKVVCENTFQAFKSDLGFFGLFGDGVLVEDALEVRRRARCITGRFGIAGQQQQSFGLGQTLGVVAQELESIGVLPKFLIGPGSKNSGPTDQRGNRLEIPNGSERLDDLLMIRSRCVVLRSQQSPVVRDLVGKLIAPRLRRQAKAQDTQDRERQRYLAPASSATRGGSSPPSKGRFR